MKFVKYAITALMGLGFLMISQGSIAASCSLTDVTANFVDPTSTQNASVCKEYAGNDSNYQVGTGPAGYENYINTDFSQTGTWTEAYKVETNNLGQSGLWDVGPIELSTPFVFVVKAATSFYAYLFDGIAGTSSDGTYLSSITNRGGNIADVSHYSIYTNTEIPIPAAAWLFASGFAAVGFSRRKKG